MKKQSTHLPWGRFAAMAAVALASLLSSSAQAALVPASVTTTGEAVSTVVLDDQSTVVKFLADGTFTVPGGATARLLLVGGGGGAGWDCSGGGGGGGVIEVGEVVLLPGTYSATVGAGGLHRTTTGGPGPNGGDTVLAGPSGTELYRAFGGGGGGSWSSTAGADGGCGGGGANGGAAGKGVPGQGYDAVRGNGADAGAGAGGSPLPCTGGRGGQHPDGGPGRTNDITGKLEVYGPGGGGGGDNGYGGLGGDQAPDADGWLWGCGRTHSNYETDAAMAAALKSPNGRAGPGGGGGGASNSNYNGGDGGSGTLIVRLEPIVLDSNPKVLAYATADAPLSVTVQAYVASAGDGGSSANVSCKIATTVAGLDEAEAVVMKADAAAGETVSTTIAGLKGGKTYYVRVFAENDLGIAATPVDLTVDTFAVFDPASFELFAEFTVEGYQGSEELAAFPVLVRLSEGSPVGFTYADCAADGSDIRFADAGGNLIPHEFETWNPAGESLAWVRLPAVTDGTTFRMYYCTETPGVPSSEDVWSRYVAVIHGGDAIANAVAGGVAATAGSGSVAASAEAGIVGGGIRKSAYNAIGVNVAAPAARLTDNGKFSVSGWFKRNGPGGSKGNGTHVLGASRAGWNNGNGYLWLQEGTKYISVAANNSHQFSDSPNGYKLADLTWAHVAFAYDYGASLTTWFDGAQDNHKTSGVGELRSSGVWTFGSYANVASDDSFRGDMDELRILDGVATGDWIQAEHDTVANADFLAKGAVQVLNPDAPRIAAPTIVEGVRRLDVSLACSVDGATVRYRVAAPGEDIDAATPVVLTASSTADEVLSFSLTDLVGDGVYTIRLEAEKNGAAARPITRTASPFAATAAFTPSVAGNDALTRAGGDEVHVLSASGTFTLATRRRARLLAVGGGGGAGWGSSPGGAGGGAGGMLEIPDVLLQPGTYRYEVGAGGAPGKADAEKGGNGGDTVLYWIDPATGVETEVARAYGGGGSGCYQWGNYAGKAGGSGGGGMYRENNQYGAGGAGTEGQGNAGGGWTSNPGATVGASGGGGAGEAGEVGTTAKGGDGGDGRMSDITGAEVWYAGGGAGALRRNDGSVTTPGKGGKGGGGDGANYGWYTGDARLDGADGLGGGGGGGIAWYHNSSGSQWYNCFGGRGGAGTLVVRFAADAAPAPAFASAEAALTDRTEATFSGAVAWEGDGATGADLVLTLGGASETVATGLKQGDAFSVAKTVERGATVAWSIKLVNSLGAESAAVAGSLAVPADDPVAITTSGETETRTVGTDTVAIFNNTAAAGSFTVPPGGAWVEMLVVGGGGAGGRAWDNNFSAAGGGAGGFVYKPALFLEAGTYSVTVGAGGAGREGGVKTDTGRPGRSGGSSYVTLGGTDVVRAYGGSGGAGRYAGNVTNDTASVGFPKGSTGGAGQAVESNWSFPVEAQQPTDPAQGNPGGASRRADVTNASGSGTYWFPGGGGGAGAPGADGDPVALLSGRGGDGLPCSITGEEVWYAGGGGAGSGYGAPGSVSYPAAAGGKGGGGYGQRWKTESDADNKGVDGLGGGGGGGGGYNGNNDNVTASIAGHSGGSGTVILRWRSLPVGTIELTPDEPVPGFRRATFSGVVDAVGGDGETVDVEIGLATVGSATTNWTAAASGLAIGDAFSVAVDGLADGTTYLASWRATNRAGASATGAAGTVRTVAGAYLVPGADATGATITQVGQDSIYTYSNPATAGTFTVSRAGYARVLLAGGGGAGGTYRGAGGGGGGVIEEDLVWLEAGTYAITVGAGGTPSNGSGTRGGNGGDSVVSLGGVELWRAYGGGGGGSWNDGTPGLGADGGSGGGSARRRETTAGNPIDPAQGHAGAPSRRRNLGNSEDYWSAGGGGGAGSAGLQASADHTEAGAGGAGRVSDISGSPEQYGAGGGAACTHLDSNASGAGGDGIGGHGRRNTITTYWVGDEEGRAGYGGGGGGGADSNANNSFIQKGAAGGSGTVIIRFTGSAPAGLADAAVVAAAPSATDPTGADVQILVRSLGGAASATLELAYGASQGSLPLRHAVGTVSEAGTVDARLPGLEPGKTYYVAAAISTPAGETVTRAVEVTIPPAGAIGGGEAGLWQAVWIRSATDRDPDIWDGVSTKDVVAGTIAAIGTGDAVDPFTGTAYPWGGLHTMFLYKGYVFLQGGTTYTFGSRMDDSLYLRIGDTALLDTQADPSHSAFADFTAPWTGWYPLDVRLGNDVGAAHGPDGDGTTSWTSFALAFNTAGNRAMIPESAWTTLIDPGDGSLLRPEDPGLRYADVAAGAVSGGSLTLTASVAPGDIPVHAYLCYGPSWGGNDPATGWNSTVDLGEVEASAEASTLAQAQVPGWGSSAVVAAVALVHPDGTVTWSAPVTYAGTSLLDLSAAATDWSQGDELTVSFTVAGGTAPYAVQLLVGTGPGTLQRVARTTLAAPGTGTLTATGLTPGSTYYWQIVVTDAAGGTASSDPNANVLMPGAAVYLNERNGIYWSVDQRTATFNGSLKALGAGDNWAWLFLTDHLYDRWPDNLRSFRGNTTNSNLRVQLTETGAFSITHTFDWGDEIGFNWVLSNATERLSWTGSRMPDWDGNTAADVAHFWLGDYQTYTWKGGAGVWNDPAMWTPDGTMEGHEQAGYPVTGSIAAFPEGTSEVTIPAGRILKPVSLEALAGADVTIKATAESGEFGLLRTDAPLRQRNIYVRENASLVFSGVKGRWIPRTDNSTALDIVGKNAYVEFTDGCDIDLGWGTGTYGIADWSNKRQGRGLRFTKGSKVYIRGCLMLAGPNEYVIDDAQVTMHPNGGRDESRVELAIWTGGRFVFRGAHPLLQANNRFAATTGNNPDAADETFVDFEIPAGGFAEAPLRSRAGNTYKLGNQGDASNKVIFRVPTNSPAATAAGILDQPLVWWPAGKETWMVLDNAYLPNPDTDYWYETTDDLAGAFTGWGVHIVGRPAVEEPQIVGLAVTNVVAGAADLFFYGIPGTNAASATFTAAIERLDDPSDTTAAVQLSGGNAGVVTAGTRFTLAATGLAEGGSYRITVSGVDGTDATLTCTETIDFDALADYAAASTTSAGATTAQDGAYTVWTFTDTESEGELVVTRAGTARILVVGGGGSGGGGDTADTNTSNPRRGGGGGGGGEVVETELYLQPGTYRVVVGAGGARVTRQTLGKTGGHSSFDYRVTALGGGGGGGNWSDGSNWHREGGSGANGGGAAGQGAGGAATATGGHAGGSSTYNAWANWNDVYAGAGGGSMAAAGGNAGLDAQNMLAAGDGADGVPSDITGRTVYYGAGGGGGGAGLNFGPGRGGLGGKGGGGEGRAFWFTAPFAVSAADAAPGTGSGGGGGAAGGHNGNVPTEQQCYWGGAGGSGVVVVRMRTVSARTADPQVAVESVEPSAGGVALALDVQSLGQGAAAADLAFAWDKAADYDAAKGYSHTNALGSVSATGAAAYTVAGLKPGTDYVGAVVASNTEGGASEVAAGAFRTAGELHADAESGVVTGSWTIDQWIENDSGVFVDNLLRASNGTVVNFQQNRRKNGTWGASVSNQGGASEDLIDGIVNRTNGRYWGTGTNSLVVFTLPEKSAVSALRFYAGWGVGNEWSPISIEGIDVRSGANEPWAELPGSAVWAEKTTTWGTVAEFAAGGNDWLARDVAQIRVRFNRNSQRDGTMYWEIEADGAAESDAPALHARAGVGRALSVASSIRTASALSVVATAAAGAPAFTDVIAVWGPAYAGEDATAWAHSRSVGTAAAGVATSIPATLDAADLADAVYVRFCGVGEDGTVSWSDSVYVPDLEVQADVPPVVVFGACTGSTGADATLTASLVSAGSMATLQQADVTLQYTLDPDGFAGGVAATTVDTFAFAEDAALGAIPAVTVKPLRPSRRYYARFVATNDGGQTGTSDVFTFETSDGGQGEITVEGGLLQQRVTGVSNAGDIAGARTMVWDETKAELVEGVIMSETTGNATSEKNGTTYAWPENGGFIYKGYVFLEGGVEYTLASGIDDTCEVTIDGAVVLTQANYAAAGVFAKVTKATTGWYPIQIIMSNGTGGAGRVGDLGLGWNTTGVQKRDKANMATFVDPGDGSLLRPTATRTIAIAGATPGANSVALDVAATSGKPVGACWAVWGAEDLGTASAVADWTGSQLLQASLDGSAATLSVTLPIDAAATPIVRVAIVPASGDVMWSAPVLLSASDPVIGPASAATDGDRMTVSGTMQSVGTGANLALSLLWGYREDLSDAQTAAVSIDASGAFTATVETIPGTNGWWRLVARDAAGGCDATLPVAFETAAGSVLKPIASATVSHHTITASGTLNVYGAGTTTATIWAGDDPDSLAPVAGSDKVLTGTGPFDIVGTVPGAPRAVYWKIVTENVAPGGSTWTSETPVYSITTEDAATYTWKPEVTEGDWNDPANWTVSGVADTTDVLGYPNNAKAKVVFLQDTAATVHVPAGTWTFATMDLNKTSLDLTFVGEGAGSTTLYGNVWGADENSAWNGWRVVFDALTVREENSISLGGSRSQDVTMRLQNGAVLSLVNWQDVRGTNVWLEAVGGSAIQWRNNDGDAAGLVLYVADGGLLLEDSTANPPCLYYERGDGIKYSKSTPGDQTVVLKGASVLRVRNYGRPYSESEDPGTFGTFTLSFFVPLKGWNDADDDAPIYASYLRGTADDKKFAWRSAGKEVPVVLEVDKDSPLLRSGRHRTVQLMEWNAGIDVKNVTLTDRKGVHMYYTYGFPQQTRTTPNSADELPTGVAADVVGQAATLLLLK